MKTKNRTLAPLLIISIIAVLIACNKKVDSGGGGTGTGSGTDPKASYTVQGSGGSCAVVSGTYTEGTPVSSSNYVTLDLIVTKTGTYLVSTNSVAGLTFANSGTFSAIGMQSIKLFASGTPTISGMHNFILSASGGCAFNLNVRPKSGIIIIQGIAQCIMVSPNVIPPKPHFFQSNDRKDDILGSIALDTIPTDEIVKMKLVNADKGQLEYESPYYVAAGGTQDYFWFTNMNEYGNGSNLKDVDTAGKLQIWIYREDGKDLIPSSNGKPSIKTIIQVPGKINGWVNPGTIVMPYTYLSPWHQLRKPDIENMFTKPNWRLLRYARRD